MIQLSDIIVLEDERVKMRPLSMNDLEHLQYFAEHEPNLWKYSMVSPAGLTAMTKYIHSALESRANGKEYAFIIYDKLTNEYAGSSRYYDIQPAANTLQLGYTWYGQKFQGTGLNKHCKYLMLDYAFQQLKVDRVEFRADNNNQRSIAAMKSIGCTVEGVLRSNMSKEDGGRRDSIVLSILKDEWNERVRLELFQKLK